MAQNLASSLYSSAAILLFFSIVTTALRCYARIVVVKAFGPDDYLILVTLGFYTIYCIWVFYGTSFSGGRHSIDIPPSDYTPALMAFYFGEVFYIITATFLKLSIGAFLLRLLKSKAQRMVVYITLAVVTSYSIAFLFLTVFQCTPVDHNWHPTSPGSCFAPTAVLGLTYAHTTVVSFSDFVFAAMPVFLVWNLQMNLYMKASVAGLMSLGAIAGITSIIRIVFIKEVAVSEDLFFQSSKLIIFTTLEPGIGIIIGSVAALRPLFKNILGKTSLFTSSKGNSKYGIGSRSRRAGNAPWQSGHDAHFQLESLKGDDGAFIGYSTKVNGGLGKAGSKKGRGAAGLGAGSNESESMEELTPRIDEGNIYKETSVERRVEIYPDIGQTSSDVVAP